MKAVICTAYGPPEVLQLIELEKPIPKDGEVLIRIHATTVTRADCEIRRFTFPGWIWLPIRLWFGIFKPRVKVLGQEFAGQVEAVGKDVTSFATGDRVFGTTGIGLGAHAEYICLREESETGEMAKIPANLGYEEAAPIPYGGSEALRFLRKGDVQRGQRVLIIGAGGSFGTFAVQLAKVSGAEVTAVDSAGKLDMLRSIGADHVIDYAERDFTAGGEAYDVIFDIVCRVRLSRLLRILRPNGRCLLANPQTSHLVRGMWTSMTSNKKVTFGVASGLEEDLPFLGELIAAGKLRPVIDRRYTLEEIVEAHRYAETEQKKGNIVITIAQDGNP
jgi:NADPH:quinone reductase-like Zn-dependent oxidoreductase